MTGPASAGRLIARARNIVPADGASALEGAANGGQQVAHAERLEERVVGADMARRDAHAGEEFSMTVGDRTYSGKGAREAAAAALTQASRINSSLGLIRLSPNQCLCDRRRSQ